jgi:hypothetical protein
MKKNIIKCFTLLAVNTLVASNLLAQIPLVFDVENRTAPGCNTAAGNTSTSNTFLPDPFAFTNGGRVATFDDWTCRRNQIKANIENFEIGPKPQKPSNITATYTGGKLTVTVVENGQTLTLSSNVTMPSGTGPFPVVIGMNSGTGSLSSSLFSGVIQIPFNHDQVVTYANGSGSINSADPYFKLYPSTNIGKYSAWSWGISRLIDGIELVKSQMNADTKRICVTGCSYAGKMALFGGAFDERIALTIAQESGGGGVNSWRTSKAYTDRTGVNIEKIDNTNYSWFKSSMRNLNPNTLPHDHHELIAMIAPRALLVLGNPTQEWLGDESGYKSTMAALEVWKSMGVEDRLGFDFTPDHNHCQASTSQNTATTTFVDKFLKGNTSANTTIRVAPTKGTQQNLSMTSVINWTPPTLTFSTPDPNTPAVSLTAPANNSSYETPISITFTTNITNAINSISNVEFYNGTTWIGEAPTQPYSFTWTDVVPGTYSITAKVTDSESLSSSSTPITITVSAPFPVVYKTSSPPTIDGTIDPIWNNENIAAIEAKKTILPTVSNDKDLSGYAKLLWDNMYVYLLAVITDDAKVNDSPNSYEDDSVEFYFDTNNDKATTYDANDVQYTFGWNDGTTVGYLPSNRSVTGITYSSISTTDGYIIEARIPWTTLQATPSAGKLIGFDFMINDDDSNGRDGKLAWNSPTDNAWENPSLFGTLKLMDNEIITSFDRIKNLDISIYPNPAKSLLYIRGLTNQSEYIITDIAGRTMQNGHSSESINISTLESGIYNLILKNNTTSQAIKFVVSQ